MKSGLTADLALAGRFLAAHPPPGEVLLCAITGSHIYGFPSPDSDIDIKGIHIAPTEAMLGLTPPPDAHDALMVFEDIECDLTTHELAQAMRLLLAGNGNVLERIFSPLQLVGERLAELRSLARGALSKQVVRHYRGYFKGMRREHLKVRRAKSMLYCYRAVMTGVHLLETGEVISHLPTLAERYGFGECMELVSLKGSTREKVELTEQDDRRFQQRWGALDERLNAAWSASSLPEEPPDSTPIEAFVRAERLRLLA